MNERQRKMIKIIREDPCPLPTEVCDKYENCDTCTIARIEALAQDTATIRIMEDALVSTAHLLLQMSKQIVSPKAMSIHKLLIKVDNALNQLKESRS